LFRLSCGHHRFKFQKGSQLFVGTPNEPLSVAAIRVSYKDGAAVAI
jgi:hypothetical protein